MKTILRLVRFNTLIYFFLNSTTAIKFVQCFSPEFICFGPWRVDCSLTQFDIFPLSQTKKEKGKKRGTPLLIRGLLAAVFPFRFHLPSYSRFLVIRRTIENTKRGELRTLLVSLGRLIQLGKLGLLANRSPGGVRSLFSHFCLPLKFLSSLCVCVCVCVARNKDAIGKIKLKCATVKFFLPEASLISKKEKNLWNFSQWKFVKFYLLPRVHVACLLFQNFFS